MRRIIISLLMLLASADSMAYFRFLVIHSQTSDEPSCPTSAGWSQVWKGYSHVGTWLNSGQGSPQDLGQPGSCLEKKTDTETFVPLRGIRCNRSDCDYDAASTNVSLYLVNKNNLVAQTINDNSEANNKAIQARISRCAVCQGSKPILVKHSLKGTEPDCPGGWTSLWAGYSLAMLSRDTGRDAGQNLSDTGSCLPDWVAAPVVHCEEDKCTYITQDTDTLWLLNHDTQTNLASQSPANSSANLSRISRCRVCVRN